ncbi:MULTISPECIES: hypothetical protein [Burkholderia]|uniref:hypothetical protein n=1 Tax=Burkholderia TaxID=32008 RepID=UPI000B1E526E|nr:MULTISPECIES: hypothetical protein [Burkholderia]
MTNRGGGFATPGRRGETASVFLRAAAAGLPKSAAFRAALDSGWPGAIRIGEPRPVTGD